MGKREKVREDQEVGGSTAWDRSCWNTGVSSLELAPCKAGRCEQGNWWKRLSAGKAGRKREGGKKWRLF